MLHWQLNRCHGTLSVYQSNISKYKLDLKQAQYNDIDRRYFNHLIQLKVYKCLVSLFQLLHFTIGYLNWSLCLQTTEMANKDLDRYYSALDKWALDLIINYVISNTYSHLCSQSCYLLLWYLISLALASNIISIEVSIVNICYLYFGLSM